MSYDEEADACYMYSRRFTPNFTYCTVVPYTWVLGVPTSSGNQPVTNTLSVTRITSQKSNGTIVQGLGRQLKAQRQLH